MSYLQKTNAQLQLLKSARQFQLLQKSNKQIYIYIYNYTTEKYKRKTSYSQKNNSWLKLLKFAKNICLRKKKKKLKNLDVKTYVDTKQRNIRENLVTFN